MIRALALCVVVWLGAGQALAAAPEPVRFQSRDGATELTGLLYRPDVNFLRSFLSDTELPAGQQGRRAAIILIEDGAAVDASPESRSRAWAEFWSERGLFTLVMAQGSTPVPRSGPRTSLWETGSAARPLDAYGALDYLRSRPDVLPSRIGLQGSGATAVTVFAALDLDRNAEIASARGGGFRAAIVLYPACRDLDAARYRSYAPMTMFIAGADVQGHAAACQRLASGVGPRSIDFVSNVLDGAPMAFDDPTKKGAPAYASALEKARVTLEKFVGAYLRP